MNFTFENQGTSTFLVYEIQPEDMTDSMSLGMLTNNNIPGLANTIYMQSDTTKYIKYNVSAKISVKQFFTGAVNQKRLLGVFQGIVKAMLSAEEYMIDPRTILLDLNYIFADVSTCDTVLICLPIANRFDTEVDIRSFFKNIMFNTQFDQTENCDYVAMIINYLNSAPQFLLPDFRNLLDQIEGSSNANPYFFASPIPNAGQAVPQRTPVSQPVQPSVPNTASGMPQPSVPQGGIPAGGIANAQPSVPPMQQTTQPNVGYPQQQNGNPQGGFPQGGFQQGGIPQGGYQQTAGSPAGFQQQPPYQQGAQGMYQQPAPPVNGKKDKKQKKQKPPKNNTPQMNIPGQQAAGQPIQPQSENSMSLFYLLQHYNKDNAAQYKAQKEAKKQQKGAGMPAPTGLVQGQGQGYTVPGAPQGGPGQNRGFAIPGQQEPVQRAGQQQGFGMPGPGSARQDFQQHTIQQPPQPSVQPQVQPQITNPQMQQTVQPTSNPEMPAYQPAGMPQTQSANFGDTTVLGGGDKFGQTTVLGMGMQQAQQPEPHLLRTKNNEKILLNKPVYRIGKERSYVDYFISDNPAVSRSHANLVNRDGEYFIVDTNSTNHTFVNGQMIQSNVETKLSHSDKIRLANEEFEFRMF